MKENFEGIGKRISKRMNTLNLKQTDLCRITNLSKNAISNYVNDIRTPDTTACYKISKALGISVEWLLTGEDSHEFSPEEIDLIMKFRNLDPRDHEEVRALIEIKYKRAMNNL
ncbi:helix-turn-helix domain-containing protein [Alkalibaculum sp. M08DMB]|uniref:Helix-turn-helix domain-containing protein n=1 Tax=Alkalibaculum sporogenes TaxID=2655001 RepID=A0A6A7KAD2_9FIRM|nr:helix-turn-helix transcriptional regulator [Alkalibaculum sporogenes]MPW26147.1 helix-turn-helix domain-containing protein [Alkalibaculum sporogenes]